MGYVLLLGQDRLQAGESAFVQIRLEEPTFALPGDRFIIRQYSPMITIGGGEILDAMPQKHRRADKSLGERLRVFKEGSIDDRIMAVVAEAGLHAIELSSIAARRGLSPARVLEQLDHLLKAGRIRILSENPRVVVSAVTFKQAADAALLAVKRFHEASPLVQGIGREELKARVFGDASNLLFQAVLDKLAAEKKIAVAQDVIHEFGRKVTLKESEERMRSQLAERFRSLGLQVTPLDQIIDALKLDRNTARKLVHLMLKENALIKITEEMLVDRAAMDKLIADLRALKLRNPKFGVGEFKNLAGVTRKHAIPLLEYLDRQRVTRRVGDERVIL
jgi:selenocysteine-specific elongation factor